MTWEKIIEISYLIFSGVVALFAIFRTIYNPQISIKNDLEILKFARECAIEEAQLTALEERVKSKLYKYYVKKSILEDPKLVGCLFILMTLGLLVVIIIKGINHIASLLSIILIIVFIWAGYKIFMEEMKG
jgi:hypothetical protein